MMDRTAQQAVEAHSPPKADLDGLVDRYFNRKISALLTRLFLQMGLSPNAITVLSLFIGLVAAAFFARGGYAAAIIGGLLFQLSAIVDCCDGEVARLTHRESRFGRQLDLAADNIVHVAIFAGVAWGAYLQQGAVQRSWLPLALGSAAVVGSSLSLWLVIRAQGLRDRQALASPTQASRADFILKNMASRDFSVVLLIFALVDGLKWFLWLAAVGSNIFWVVIAWITRPSSLARA